jgi:ABC-type Zn uptake system ZnuABC Zn-binding protein ZnuA
VHVSKRCVLVLTAGSVAALSLTACGGHGGKASGASGTLQVVATTTQVADFVRNIGGSHVQVTQLIKPNASAHEYEPTPADITSMGKAKALFENGAGLEKKWLEKPVESSGFHGARVDSSSGVKLRQGRDEETGKPEPDPHIWQDPRNAEIMCRNILKGLVKADPSHKAAYRSAYKTYEAKLARLDRSIAHRIGTLPRNDREIVTNHDAFGYYIGRYHLTYVGSVIPDFDDHAELSGKQLDGLVKKVKQQHVRAVFGETSLPPKTSETIARQAHVRVIAGDGSLYGDSLGPKGSAGDTYLKSEKFNTKTIVDALK